MDPEHVDDDAFLTQLESKLRGPFSSLELAKAVSQAALSSGHHNSASHHDYSYLEQVARVLSRAEKVTQLQVLAGLLGLDPAADTDAAARSILVQAQEEPEEWVRVLAGVVQSALFGNSKDEDAMEEDNDDGGKAKRQHGEEAQDLLEKTCREIIHRVRGIEQKTATIDEDTEHRLGQSDADPITLAPFRYALLSPDQLFRLMPEAESHDHFEVNEGADILLMDARLELEKKKEEEEYQLKGIQGAASAAPKANNKQPPPDAAAPDFPGFRSSSSSKKPAPPPSKAKPKSNMFLPSKRSVPSAGVAASKKRPHAASGAKPTLKPVQRTGLHTRKAGAAQALLGKSRRVARPGGVVGGEGAAAKAHSKMKMIDVAEVQGLEDSKQLQQQQQQQPVAGSSNKLGRKAQVLSGKKRGKPADSSSTAAAQRPGKVARLQKKSNDDNDKNSNNDRKPAAVAEPANALATAALTAYQQKARTAATAKPPPPPPPPQQPHAHKQQDWRQLLREKSNRLSDSDRVRIEQFFNHHGGANPTPEQGSTYKMKLHEERTNDPKTGEPVKETYYLELDYNNFTSTQSKKVKRY